jgi:hypothetical protein
MLLPPIQCARTRSPGTSPWTGPESRDMRSSGPPLPTRPKPIGGKVHHEFPATGRSLAPAAPSLRQPRPQHAICGGPRKTVTARSIDHGELVSKDDDLQGQRCPGANEKAERVKQRNDDGRHDCRLSEKAHDLNRRNTYKVLGRHNVTRRNPFAIQLSSESSECEPFRVRSPGR